MIKAPPRICTGSTFKTLLGKESGVLGYPDRQMGDRDRSAVVNAAQLLSIAARYANEHCAKERKEEKKRETNHDRPSARSNGTLSRNSSGWPINSFGTER